MIVEFEAVELAQCFGETAHGIAVNVLNFAARAANRVMVVRRRARDVRCFSALVDPRANLAPLLQQAKRAIDRGQRDGIFSLTKAAVDLRRREVALLAF